MPIALREVSSTHPAFKRRAFVVAGMHRSGTSAITRTLSLLGVSLPSRLMPAQDNNNATGFWESQSVAQLNDEILNALDSEWDDVFAFRPRPYLSNFDGYYLGRAAELIEQEFHGSELIVLKDPRLSVLTSFWERALRAAGYATNYIVAVRNPLEVAESLRSRDGFPREKSLLLWSSYMLAVERDTRGLQRTFVSYDDLMRDWRAVRSRIESSSGVPFPRDTAAAAIEIDRFLDRKQRHHQTQAEDFYSRPDVPEHVKTLYRAFLAASRGEEVDYAAVDAIEGELAEVETLVGPLLADLRGRSRKLGTDLAQVIEAQAEASARADALADELAVERQLRQDYAEAAARADSLAAELATERQQRQEEAEAAAQIGQRRAAEAHDMERQLGALASLVSETEERLGRERQRAEAMAAEVDGLKREVSRVRAVSAETEAELRTTFKRLRDDHAKEIRRAEDAWTSAEAAVRASDSELAERKQELERARNELEEQQERNQRATVDLEWLSAVTARLSRRPRWWALLPTSWRRARELRRMKRLRLFDADAYLAQYPDVTGSGLDPLEHYLRHGIHEGRSRPF